MIDTSRIRPAMDVVASDGKPVGRVDRLDADTIRLVQTAVAPRPALIIPLAWVARVERHVHLNVPAAAVLGRWPDQIVDAAEPRGARRPRWVIWAGAFGAVAGLTLARSLEHATTPTIAVARPAATVVDDVRAFLASPAPPPRRFAFGSAIFDRGSAVIRPTDAATIAALATTLAAFPAARVEVVAFADTPPADAAGAGPAAATDAARLASRRAAAIARALVVKGIASARIATASDATPDDAGPGTDRKPELVVTAKQAD